MAFIHHIMVSLAILATTSSDPNAQFRRPYNPYYGHGYGQQQGGYEGPGPYRGSHPAQPSPYAGPQTSLHSGQSQSIVARVDLKPADNSGVKGTLYLKQNGPGSAVLLTGYIKGLYEGAHGFHVHMNGELTNDCKDAGGHFNPFMKNHGNPFSLDRHVGDLGNIKTFSRYHPTEVFILDKIITLEPGRENSVLGRAIVVHEDVDDLGEGGDNESLRTGNAGSRLACGVIARMIDY
ncbi:hypothetical protein TCAL_03987 [Tigriopus californicus]|uniref:Superoxide dismutase [Cu-Zn] n=1 Tax=Tigriopus californicus TaxID=6832 RepID=A0A553NFU6_TIGCA|nr:superoxide dismutase [Cu-Zn] 5-like [Tigriopus californicus]XP_059094044.1 superoxide dismutase [Cu-Zn] 5-like [Tigriopus californicus]TRY64268.1 hypothetical protein TCAL_03987 [Tigriopus californicus]|eukprot:TCALIF_03987-PA protein Name:"Similar to Sod1 Superoxide dismutase [Cu-Zn] (Mus musculus)" AED:0.34 eAED:0.34 QI:145/1/1/1/0.66/0.75/4/251/234